jgi:hypothetical protein
MTRRGEGTSLISSYRPGRGLLAPLIAFGLAAVLTAAVAHAQNLDEGKPPAKLFADGCGSCHRSPRGLAKGRFSFTLAWFLKDHYATSSTSANALAAYLASVDSGPRTPAKPKGGAHPSRSPRPPAPGR